MQIFFYGFKTYLTLQVSDLSSIKKTRMLTQKGFEASIE